MILFVTMKHLRAKAIVFSLLVVAAYLGVTWVASNKVYISPHVLARDFVRLETRQHVWRASQPERALHYLKHWGQTYNVKINPLGTTQLTNVVAVYSAWAARPVYVHRDIASLGIGAISVSARTHEGLVEALEQSLRTNGVSCALNREGSATIMTLIDGYKMRSDQIPVDRDAIKSVDHPDYE
jgi:hypothetical protein